MGGNNKPVSMGTVKRVTAVTQVPGPRDASGRGRKGIRRRSRSQAPAPASSSSSEDSVSNASVASVASARELRLPDLDMQVKPKRLSSQAFLIKLL